MPTFPHFPVSRFLTFLYLMLFKLGLLVNLSYYEAYFNTVSCLSTNFTAFSHYSLTQGLLLYQIALHGGFLFFQRTLPHRILILSANVSVLESLSQLANFWIAFFLANGLFFNRLMYLENSGLNGSLLKGVLLDSETSFFVNWRLSKRNIPTKVRHFAVAVRNAFQAGSLFLYLYTIDAWIRFQPHFRAIGAGPLAFLVFHLNGTLFYLTMRFVFEVYYLIASISMILAVIGYYRHSQMWAFLRRSSLPLKVKFPLFLRHTHAYIAFLTDFNHIYGRALFAFFLYAFPNNATLLMVLLLDSTKSASFQMVACFLVLGEFIFIFGVHLHAVQNTLHFHRPVKYWRRFPAKGTEREKVSVRLKLQLAVYLETFLTNNMYYISFGKYGSISYASYRKVCRPRLKGKIVHKVRYSILI